MKFYNTFLFLIILLVLVACRKKEVTQAGTEMEAMQSEPEPRKDSVNGYFTVSKDYIISEGQLKFNFSEQGAVFSKSLMSVTNLYSPKHEDVGDVFINEVKLLKLHPNTNFQTYGEYNPTYISGPFTWSISGSSEFKPFTYSLKYSYPVFEGLNQIPDLIYKSGVTAFLIYGTDADSVQARFICECSDELIKRQKRKNDAIILSEQEVSNLSNGGASPFTLELTFTKVAYMTNGGKFYLFTTKTRFTKKIEVK